MMVMQAGTEESKATKRNRQLTYDSCCLVLWILKLIPCLLFSPLVSVKLLKTEAKPSRFLLEHMLYCMFWTLMFQENWNGNLGESYSKQPATDIRQREQKKKNCTYVILWSNWLQDGYGQYSTPAGLGYQLTKFQYTCLDMSRWAMGFFGSLFFGGSWLWTIPTRVLHELRQTASLSSPIVWFGNGCWYLNI